MPRVAGGCGECVKALGRRHCPLLGGPFGSVRKTDGLSSANAGRGLSRRVSFCQGKIKKRRVIHLTSPFRTAHGQIPFDHEEVKLGMMSHESSSARRWPNATRRGLAELRTSALVGGQPCWRDAHTTRRAHDDDAVPAPASAPRSSAPPEQATDRGHHLLGPPVLLIRFGPDHTRVGVAVQ